MCDAQKVKSTYRRPSRYAIVLSKMQNESRTHFADILRYMLEGVRNSAGIDEKTGTRFGGLGDLIAAASTSRTVSRDG